jgi:phosphatidylinositol alpha 1,6-mannosyltransferase
MTMGWTDSGAVVIVHITDCFHPRLGGIETQVGDLAAAQRARGETVHVITATPAPADGRVYGYPVHRVTAPLPWELPVHPRAGTHLVRILRRLNPDVVHVHLGSVSPFAWSALAAARRCGLPTVATVHSMWGPASRAMYRGLDHLWDASDGPLIVTAVSSAAVGLILKNRPRLEAVAVPNGISPLAWRATTPYHRASGPVHIVAVGRLAPRKQPIGLLRLLREAQEQVGPDGPMRVTVAGEGPARPLMRAYLRRHDMTDWVQLVGRLDRPGVRDLLASADIFVNPTVRESFGIATLEARTAGVPVVARTGNGVAEFVRHGTEGLLCASRAEFVAAIAHLVRDTALREQIGRHNRTSEAVECGWPAVTAAFARCYDRAIALVPKPPGPPTRSPRPASLRTTVATEATMLGGAATDQPG